ncbi:CRISPR-associated helicase Cas3, putative [Rhodospirillum centenum SW]|uniref:CRISPR-associated helicase Cas3, putative n=2 Tax=Rhodospirillum centenum TaxID=34018 RepID=B6IWM7_RHOCS|nr:CRISPR-associated helicase Cas3, putative [Rhodospirillum centenum SW]
MRRNAQVSVMADMFSRWGKARSGLHLLVFHLLDVAAVLDAGFERRPALLARLADGLGLDRDAARAMLLTVLALHDIGKVATGFQASDREAAGALGLALAGQERMREHHSAVGQALLLRLLTRHRAGSGLPDGGAAALPVMEALFALSTGHHGRPVLGLPKVSLLMETGALTDDDMDIAATLVRAVAGLFGWRQGIPDREGLTRLSPLLNGLFTLCDWLGSSDHFACRNQPQELRAYYEGTALPTARRMLDTIRPTPFGRLTPRPPAGFAALFPRLGRDGAPAVPTPLQALADRLFTADALPDGPLLTIIEDLPGAGKTEAGDLITHRLIALDRADGAYVGLPTMATADAAFARRFDRDGGLDFGAALFTEVPQVVLAHSRRHRTPGYAVTPTRAGLEEGEGYALDWFNRSSRRALLTDLGVGTVDQALAGALRARYATVRLAGLWRKVLLVDEVHAYDSYMQTLLHALLRWQGRMGDPVVLMSATLPARLRQDLIRAYAEGAGWADVAAMAERTRPGAYPLLTLVSGQGIAQHPLAPVPGPGTRPVRFEAAHDLDTVEDRLRGWLAQGRCVLWFRNTVGDAVAAWERLCDLDPLLYHARFLPADRSRIEAALLDAVGKDSCPAARRGRLVIATQAAEQSLDLDADEMVIDLAPADAVVQRLGRRRRHARMPDGAPAPDGVERRPDGPVLLLTPRPDRPGPAWYRSLFGGAAQIYADDARLWLTARCLLDPGAIPGRRPGLPPDALILADDLRPLIEAVYAAEPAGVPDALAARHLAAEGADISRKQRGRVARLSFRQGLCEEWAQSGEQAEPTEDDPRTRLIDSHTVLLATYGDGPPRFLGAGDDRALSVVEASECRCPRRLEPLRGQEALVQQLLTGGLDDTDRRKAGRAPVIWLRPAGDGLWRGRALDLSDAEETGSRPGSPAAATEVIVEYCRTRGLRVLPQRQAEPPARSGKEAGKV